MYPIQIHMDLMELYRNLHDTNAANQQLATARSAISALNEQGGDRASFLRLRALIKMDDGDLTGAKTT